MMIFPQEQTYQFSHQQNHCYKTGQTKHCFIVRYMQLLFLFFSSILFSFFKFLVGLQILIFLYRVNVLYFLMLMLSGVSLVDVIYIEVVDFHKTH